MCIYISFGLYNDGKHDGRVVKALDLSSNGRMSAWVRTPLVLVFFLHSDNLHENAEMRDIF